MLPFFTTTFRNSSTLTHDCGRKAANAVEDARIGIACFFGVQSNEIVVTWEATESNNAALNLLGPGDHRGVVYHSNIAQAAGKIALSLTNVDLVSFSAHKLCGPKGIGGLFVRRSVRIEPRSAFARMRCEKKEDG